MAKNARKMGKMSRIEEPGKIVKNRSKTMLNRPKNWVNRFRGNPVHNLPQKPVKLLVRPHVPRTWFQNHPLPFSFASASLSSKQPRPRAQLPTFAIPRTSPSSSLLSLPRPSLSSTTPRTFLPSRCHCHVSHQLPPSPPSTTPKIEGSRIVWGRYKSRMQTPLMEVGEFLFSLL